VHSDLVEPDPAAPDGPGDHSRQILVIDDDDLVRLALKATLELLGHRVATASTGEEGLKSLAFGLRPDLVILDMNMPGLGGAATLPLLRSLCPDLPILLATGKADLAALELVRLHAGVALLPKPFSAEDLQDNLQVMCAGPEPKPKVLP
jgi:CheY-like chemotaxis protein